MRADPPTDRSQGDGARKPILGWTDEGADESTSCRLSDDPQKTQAHGFRVETLCFPLPQMSPESSSRAAGSPSSSLAVTSSASMSPKRFLPGGRILMSSACCRILSLPLVILPVITSIIAQWILKIILKLTIQSCVPRRNDANIGNALVSYSVVSCSR